MSQAVMRLRNDGRYRQGNVGKARELMVIKQFK